MRGDSLIVEVELVPLRELKPHEKVVGRTRLYSVARAIAKLGAVLRPIIVEARSLAIIDGHHRYHALELLGARYAPIVRARYGVEVEAVKPPTHKLKTPKSMVWRLIDLYEAEAGGGGGTALIRVEGHTVTLRLDPLQAYYTLERLAETLRKECTAATSCTTVQVIPPPLTGRHVAKLASNCERLPPKSTLHQTPLKKLLAPVKLSQLT